MKLKCPYCGFEGDSSEFNYLYETTLYVVNSKIEREERERSILVVCPKCRQGFLLEDPYRKFHGE